MQCDIFSLNYNANILNKNYIIMSEREREIEKKAFFFVFILHEIIDFSF